MRVVQEEKWATFYPECEYLFVEHHQEVGELNENLPLEPDIAMCERLDASGMLQIVTARHDGKLVGYCIFYIGHSLSSKNILCGTQTLYFVTKSERKSIFGIELYMSSIRLMKERGVKMIYPHHWLRGDSAKLKPFFERMGGVELEHVFGLWIGE